MSERILPFEAVENFRDYGDYALGGGGWLARGRLYRSAHHGRATEADLERLAALNLAVIVDLRRPEERRRDPCRRPQAFGARVIETDIGGGGEAPHLKFLRTEALTPESGHAFMLGEYRRLPLAPEHVDLFGRYFQALADTDGPVLIHCAAGKDRTGLLAALTHRMLGAHPDDVMADYLLTNQARAIDTWVGYIAEHVEREFGTRPTDEAVRSFLSVHPAWLESAFAAIEERFGGVDAYLQQALGVDAAARERIRQRIAA
ncbi:MAG TPA: tyrosine-protein phosphatase [Caulobacteraceae bacterium]|jgi:protein tyrosine/serine phosphatase